MLAQDMVRLMLHQGDMVCGMDLDFYGGDHPAPALPWAESGTGITRRSLQVSYKGDPSVYHPAVMSSA
jgi:hypothetical protein